MHPEKKTLVPLDETGEEIMTLINQRNLQPMSEVKLATVDLRESSGHDLTLEEMREVFNRKAGVVKGAKKKAMVAGNTLEPKDLLIEDISLEDALENYSAFLERVCQNNEAEDITLEQLDTLKGCIRKFVENCINYLYRNNKLDNACLTRLILAIQFGGAGGMEERLAPKTGLIRAPNPLSSDAEKYFTIGHDCSSAMEMEDYLNKPLTEEPQDGKRKAELVIKSKSLVHFGLKMLSDRIAAGCPISNELVENPLRIPREEFLNLVPPEVLNNKKLEMAFFTACMSQGAQQKYSQTEESGGLGREMF